MSSDSTDEGGVPHYAYPVLRIFPPFRTEIAVLCHHAKTNDIFFLPGGRVSFRFFSQILLGYYELLGSLWEFSLVTNCIVTDTISLMKLFIFL